jgi:hypothetical protein
MLAKASKSREPKLANSATPEQIDQINHARDVIQAARRAGDNLKACAKCNKPLTPANAKTCPQCTAVGYCDKACKKAHWKVHKKQCGVMAQATDITSVAHPDVLGAIDNLSLFAMRAESADAAAHWGDPDSSTAIVQFKQAMEEHSIPQKLADGMFSIASGMPIFGVAQSRHQPEEFCEQAALTFGGPNNFDERALEMQTETMVQLGLKDAYDRTEKLHHLLSNDGHADLTRKMLRNQNLDAAAKSQLADVVSSQKLEEELIFAKDHLADRIGAQNVDMMERHERGEQSLRPLSFGSGPLTADQIKIVEQFEALSPEEVAKLPQKILAFATNLQQQRDSHGVHPRAIAPE